MDLPKAPDNFQHWLGDGYFLVARAIARSSLVTMRPEDFKVAVLLMGKANWTARKWFDGTKDVLLAPGQTITSYRHLAEEFHLSTKTIRTALKNLEASGFLTSKSGTRWTLISLNKYRLYQDPASYTGTPSAHHRHTTGTPSATTESGNQGIRESEKKENPSDPPTPPAGADTPPPDVPLTYEPDAAPPARARRRKLKGGAPPNPDVRRFIDTFVGLYLEKTGEKYHVNGGKDGTTAKRLLSTYPLAKLEGLARRFFEVEDDFARKAGYTMGVFSVSVNKLASQVSGATDSWSKYRSSKGVV